MHPQNDKMNKEIADFLQVYQALSPQAKGEFEAQIMAFLKSQDEKTKSLYQALLQAAKDGVSPKQAILDMTQAHKRI